MPPLNRESKENLELESRLALDTEPEWRTSIPPIIEPYTEVVVERERERERERESWSPSSRSPSP